MKRTKEQKGITLIALIITIVVLMILAVVAINSIRNDGIIAKALNVKNMYNEKVNEEQKLLNYYDLLLEEKAWTQNGTKVTRGNVTLEVGDYLYYDSGVDGINAEGGWRVLGAENGYLLVVASTYVEELTLTGMDGYLNGVTELNQICEKYANEEYAVKARSIMIEDINRIAGYNPEVYRKDIEIETGKYGNTVSYKMNADGTYVTFAGPDGVWITADGTDERAENGTVTSFQKIDGTYLKGDEIVTVKSNYYGYNLNTLTEDLSDEVIGWSKGDKVYSTIHPFSTSPEKEKLYYWLANRAEYARFGYVCYSIRAVHTRGTKGRSIASLNMWVTSSGPVDEDNHDALVRAVVYIDPDLKIVDEGNFDNIQAWGLESLS